MKLLDINGKIVNVAIRPQKYGLGATFRSEFQNKVREYLLEKYKHEIILEDWTIPGSHLSLDFFIPRIKIAVECNGNQHNKYNPFFHGDRVNDHKFANQIIRDNKKRVWADNNNISLYVVNENDSLNCIGL